MALPFCFLISGKFTIKLPQRMTPAANQHNRGHRQQSTRYVSKHLGGGVAYAVLRWGVAAFRLVMKAARLSPRVQGIAVASVRVAVAMMLLMKRFLVFMTLILGLLTCWRCCLHASNMTGHSGWFLAMG